MYALQSFTKEISLFVKELVKVETVKGEEIYGTLKSFDPGTLSVILEDALIGDENFKMLMINGASMTKICLKEKKIDLDRLKELLEKSFPNL